MANAFEPLLRAHRQALVDLALARTSEVTFVEAEPECAPDVALALTAASAELGFVTARVSLRAHPIAALEDVVRAVALSVRGRDASIVGLRGMLEAFGRVQRRRAVEAFDAACDVEGARGDLVVLCRAYLAARQAPRRELDRLAAWLEGVSLSRTEEAEGILSQLESRTARQTLGQLSRLVRALGATGLVVLLDEAEACAKLPERRRDDAYTVLRELVDDGDSPRGLVATRVLVVGGPALFRGPRALGTLTPLGLRVLGGRAAAAAPHQPYLVAVQRGVLRDVHAPQPEEAAHVRWLVRAAHGLPPIEAVAGMTVGSERIDATVDRLFEHASHQGSVFAALTGAYGSGKTHLLLHLEERALADARPVLRLSLERLDGDLGNPQRHLRRLLGTSAVRLGRAPEPVSLLDVLDHWVRDEARATRLVAVLREISDEGGDAGRAAARALREATAAGKKGRARALTSFLGARGLDDKPGGPTYRLDAYRRLLLWLSLLERLESRKGPVLLVDEAENLMRRSSHAEQRTALRSLAFYCGGALPSACVVLAITPEAFAQLRAATAGLVRELSGQETILACEDVVMLGRRLSKLAPVEVPALGRPQLRALAQRVRATHATVRGPTADAGWDAFVGAQTASADTPRHYVRALLDRLEQTWWNAPGVH